MTFREKLEMWLDNPNTPPDAWMRLSFPEIDKQADVNSHNDSALDNIFYPEDKDLTLESFGVLKFTGKRISDHYLVWAAFDILGIDDAREPE